MYLPIAWQCEFFADKTTQGLWPLTAFFSSGGQDELTAPMIFLASLKNPWNLASIGKGEKDRQSHSKNLDQSQKNVRFAVTESAGPTLPSRLTWAEMAAIVYGKSARVHVQVTCPNCPNP